MAEIFAGKWKLDRSENFDDYLKELGKLTTVLDFKQQKRRGTNEIKSYILKTNGNWKATSNFERRINEHDWEMFPAHFQ